MAMCLLLPVSFFSALLFFSSAFVLSHWIILYQYDNLNWFSFSTILFFYFFCFSFTSFALKEKRTYFYTKLCNWSLDLFLLNFRKNAHFLFDNVLLNYKVFSLKTFHFNLLPSARFFFVALSNPQNKTKNPDFYQTYYLRYRLSKYY